MANKLKSCPFCGGQAEVHGNEFCWVRCKKCKCETRGVHGMENAIVTWNCRVGEDLLERMEDDGR